jgi:hypothetical protein
VTRIPDSNAALRYQAKSAADPRNACLLDRKLFGPGVPIW